MDPAEETKLRMEAAVFADQVIADLRAKVEAEPKKKVKKEKKSDELF